MTVCISASNKPAFNWLGLLFCFSCVYWEVNSKSFLTLTVLQVLINLNPCNKLHATNLCNKAKFCYCLSVCAGWVGFQNKSGHVTVFTDQPWHLASPQNSWFPTGLPTHLSPFCCTGPLIWLHLTTAHLQITCICTLLHVVSYHFSKHFVNLCHIFAWPSEGCRVLWSEFLYLCDPSTSQRSFLQTSPGFLCLWPWISPPWWQCKYVLLLVKSMML